MLNSPPRAAAARLSAATAAAGRLHSSRWVVFGKRCRMSWVVLLSALEPPVCLVKTQGWLQLFYFSTVLHLSELIQKSLLPEGLRSIWLGSVLTPANHKMHHLLFLPPQMGKPCWSRSFNILSPFFTSAAMMIGFLLDHILEPVTSILSPGLKRIT